MSSGFQGYSGKNFINYTALSFSLVEAVVVSGDGPNFCGHMMLRVDNYYFHVSGVYSHPMYMNASEYKRYISQNKKTELFRTRRILINRKAARDKLKSLLSEKWLWLIVPNNCTDFVEEVIGSGENDFGIISNCPTQLAIKIRQEKRLKSMVLTRRGYRPKRSGNSQ
ncbi:MAG: hypothetical protein L3J70_05765 [Gammaproteobacteria bacterium]|nr:hypothetical protein [Gammaproteobacteria bacterium]